MAGVSVLLEVVQQLAVLVPAVAVAGKALLRRGNDVKGGGGSLGQQHGLGVQDHGNLNRALFDTEREKESAGEDKKIYGYLACVY